MSTLRGVKEKGLRRALILPWRTYSALSVPVTDTLPFRDELLCRIAMFLSKCVLAKIVFFLDMRCKPILEGLIVSLRSVLSYVCSF